MSAFLGKDKLILDTNALDDSDNVGAYVRSSDGTLITHTTDGLKEALDVHIAGADGIGIYAEDDGHVSGDKGQFILAVRNDNDASLTSADGGYSPIAVDEFGRVKTITDLDVDFDYVYAEDSAHADGDLGSYSLAVRQDALASSVSADGDYGSFKINNRGALWVAPVGNVDDDAVDAENPVKVGSRSVWGALAAISATGDRANMISDKYRRVYVNNGSNISLLASNKNITDTAAVVVASNLGGRRQILVQNAGNKEIFVGDAAVTAASGLRVAAGATITLELGQDVSLYGIAGTGNTVAIRVLELA